MRPTISVLRTWSPGQLGAPASQLLTAARVVESTADGLVRDFDTHATDWQGTAADRARERVHEQRRATLTVAEDWITAAHAVERAAQELATLRTHVLGLVAAAQGEDLWVDDAGRVRPRFAGLDIAEWVRRLRAAQTYSAAIGEGLAGLDQADEALALALASSSGVADPGALLEGAPPMGEAPGAAGGEEFVLGPPTRPQIAWDEDYVWNSDDAGPGDYASAAEWKAKMGGARVLRRDLDDALDAYDHYWSNTGDRFHIDYEEAIREDPAIARNVDAEIARAVAGAQRLIDGGHTSFSMSGDAASAPAYPETENWQKTVGGYQQWSSGDVTVSGDTVTMVVTVHAEDYYNFNRGQADIASGAPDDENGRFTEVGWAKPFPTSGQVTRTVTWQLGDPSAPVVSAPEPEESR